MVVSAGCGHRDCNTAADDIAFSSCGPNPAASSAQWRCLPDHTRGDPRAAEAWAACMPASGVTGP